MEIDRMSDHSGPALIQRIKDLEVETGNLRRRLEKETRLREETRKALENYELGLRKFLDTAPVAIAIYRDKKFLFCNKAHARLVGAESASDLVGRSVLDVIDPEFHDLFNERNRAVLQERAEAPLTAYNCRSLDGSLIFMETIAIPFTYQGRPAVMGIAVDVSKRKLAEEELKVQCEQLIRADKLASLGALVSGVAHEINNPNNFILLNASVLSQIWEDLRPLLDSVREDRGDYRIGKMNYSQLREHIPSLCAGILDGSRRIKVIVQELKDFARPEVPGVQDEVNMNEVINAAVSLMTNLIQKSTSRFSIDLSPRIPSIRGNFQRLEQVMVNLIVNACQALPDKDKGLRVSTRFRTDAGRVTVKISDEGVGLPVEDIGRITDPFFTTKRDSGGTGLGLSISSRIVSDHGGSMEFDSRPGVGTTVTVWFPVAERAH